MFLFKCAYGIMFFASALSVHDEKVNLRSSVPTCTEADPFACNDDGSECISRNLACNGVSECSTGRDENVLTCGCLENEFQCNTSMCIDMIRRCDTHQDCDNGADEEDCKKYACPKTHSKCGNYFCVPRDVICDFKDDCGDNSDEENCPKVNCYETQFQCNNSQCIGMGFLCDGTPDCEDKSDEENCDTYPRCDNGEYILENKICDGWIDCEDQSDETKCGDCKDKEFKCQNGRCVKQSNVCDGSCDCGLTCDDENDCGSLSCPVGEKFACKYFGQSFRCIDKKYLCDKSNDCWNNEEGSDESSCWDISQNCTDFKFNGEMQRVFVCPEGRCLPASGPGNVVCNFFHDCLNGEDEIGCEHRQCGDTEYRCGNGQCIEAFKRCDGRFDCFDWSDESTCDTVLCNENQKRCTSGQCVPENHWCDHFTDCPDGSDERNCDYRLCRHDEFTCNNGQCIDSKYVCFADVDADRKGCADMSHLYNCGHVMCTEDQFKCRNSYCIAESMRCDGNIDCPKSAYVDELGCPYECPFMTQECICHSDELNCLNKGLPKLPGDIQYEKGLSKFILGGNYLNTSLSKATFSEFERIVHLDLSNNSIESLPAGCFQNLYRLRTLNLENNIIKFLENGTFVGLSSLRSLYISGNQLSELHPYAFMGLSQLQILDLSNQKLEELLSNSFIGMRNVYNLDLSNNHIQRIYDGAFTGLDALLTLRIDGNDIQMIENNVFHGLPVLETLYTDEFRYCCLARFVKSCFPEPDEFSSCEDLMSNYLLRVSIWILGITAFLGNMLVVGWRIRDNRNGKVHSFLITNLAIGDFFMGLYLLIIAFVDTHYRGKYSISDKYWRGSDLCKFAGFISTFSSELSVFTLTIITLDRLICIIFPLKLKRLGIKEALIVMPCIWILVVILSGIPLFGIDYFENFYGRSGVCLAFHITPEKPKGWEYSVFVFLVLNFVSFLVIFISYLWMFMVAKQTTTAVRKSKSKSDKSMAKRMTLIVMTDFCCWVPIIILGFASLAGTSVPPQVYAWVAVFVLPLNSAMNPILYTISTAPFMRNIRKRASRFRKSFTGSLRTSDTKHSYIEGSSHSWTRNSMYRQLELTRLRGLKKTYSAHNNHHNEKSSRLYRHGSQAV